MPDRSLLRQLRRVAGDVYAGPHPNGLSECHRVEPYRVDGGPWRCTICSAVCDVVRPQRQDSVSDQIRDVVTMAERAGCYDAADWIKGRL